MQIVTQPQYKLLQGKKQICLVINKRYIVRRVCMHVTIDMLHAAQDLPKRVRTMVNTATSADPIELAKNTRTTP